MLKEEDSKRMASSVKEENLRTKELLLSITQRKNALIETIQSNKEQQKQKELLHRKETHENLLALLAVEGSSISFRKSNNNADQPIRSAASTHKMNFASEDNPANHRQPIDVKRHNRRHFQMQ